VAQRGANPGMAALAALGAAPGRPLTLDAYHLGFVLGPRVNAGGGSAPPISARGCCRPTTRRSPPNWRRHLDVHNKERREIEARTLEAAIEAVERQNGRFSSAGLRPPPRAGIPGSSAIVAARLRERYERPACVVALADGIGRGSGRSVPASRSDRR